MSALPLEEDMSPEQDLTARVALLENQLARLMERVCDQEAAIRLSRVSEPRRRPYRTRRVVYACLATALLVLALGLGAHAFASIPDATGVIHACYVKAVGRLRVIDTVAGHQCTSLGTALTRNGAYQRTVIVSPVPNG